MASDVKILDKDNNQFKFRVCGIVKFRDKYLTVRICNNKFYCLAGGHVELGEDTDTAIRREMHEELGYEVEIIRLVTIIQNFFRNKAGGVCHEVGYYYLVEPKFQDDFEPIDYTTIENDKGELKPLEFKWFTLDELKRVDFRPTKLLELLDSEQLTNIIYKDTDNR